MNIFGIFITVYIAMIAASFWESYVEGRNAWDKKKHGWKIKLGSFTLTGYHFYLFVIMFPTLLALPFVINGWDTKLFGILLSAYFSGMVIQDFMWYVVNPVVKFNELNSDFANYYPRVRFGKVKIPIFYFLSIGIAVFSWLLLWK